MSRSLCAKSGEAVRIIQRSSAIVFDYAARGSRQIVLGRSKRPAAAMPDEMSVQLPFTYGGVRWDAAAISGAGR